MDLAVNISLEDALDRGWQILAECFRPEETGFRTELINQYWPKDGGKAEVELEEKAAVEAV